MAAVDATTIPLGARLERVRRLFHEAEGAITTMLPALVSETEAAPVLTAEEAANIGKYARWAQESIDRILKRLPESAFDAFPHAS